MRLSTTQLLQLRETCAYPALLARLNAVPITARDQPLALADLIGDVSESALGQETSVEERFLQLLKAGEIGAARILVESQPEGAQRASVLAQESVRLQQEIDVRRRAVMGLLLILQETDHPRLPELRTKVESVLADPVLLSQRPGKLLKLLEPAERELEQIRDSALERLRSSVAELGRTTSTGRNADLDRALERLRGYLGSSETLPSAQSLLRLALRARDGSLSTEDIAALHRSDGPGERILAARGSVDRAIVNAADALASAKATQASGSASGPAHDDASLAALQGLVPVAGKVLDRVEAARRIAKLAGLALAGTTPGGLCEVRFSQPRVPSLRSGSRVFPGGIVIAVPPSVDDAALPGLLTALSPSALKIVYRHGRMERNLKPIPTLDQDVVFLDIVDLIRVARCEPTVREHAFQQVLLARLPVTRIKPYQGAGPVSPEMFRGRRQALERLRQPKGATVLFSGRMMGKSSILTKLDADIRKNAQQQGKAEASVFVSSASEDLLTPLIEHLAQSLGGSSGAKYRAEDASLIGGGPHGRKSHEYHRRRLTKLRQLIMDVIQKHGRLTILVDEADNFARADGERPRQDSVAWALRDVEMENPDRLRIVFAGFQTIHREVLFKNSAFANWFGLYQLSSLPPEEARSLVVEPFADCGFLFASEAGVDRILDFTGRHPLLLHETCSRLMDRVAARRGHSGNDEVVYVQAGDVESVCRDDQLRERLRQVLSLNLEEYPRLKLMVYLILFASRSSGGLLDIWNEGFRLDDLKSTLIDLYANRFNDYFDERSLPALAQELTALGLIAQNGDRYVFVNRTFAEMVRSERGFEDEVQRLLELVTNPSYEAPRRFFTLSADDLERLLVPISGQLLLVGLAGTSRTHIASAIFGTSASAETLIQPAGSVDSLEALLEALRATLRESGKRGKSLGELLLKHQISALVLDDVDQLPTEALQAAVVDLHSQHLNLVAIGGAPLARSYVAHLAGLDVDLVTMRRLRKVDLKEWGLAKDETLKLLLNDDLSQRLMALTSGYSPLLESFREFCRRKAGTQMELIPDKQTVGQFEQLLTRDEVKRCLLSTLLPAELLLLQRLYEFAEAERIWDVDWEFVDGLVLEKLVAGEGEPHAKWLDRLEVLRILDLVEDLQGAAQRKIRLQEDGPIHRALRP